VRVLVLVLGARVAPYPALIRTIRETWASVAVDGVETIFYYGGDALRFDGDELVLPVSGGALDIGRKTIACFDWALANRDFDLVYRTNCSSYIDLPNLFGYALEHGGGQRFYSGLIGTFEQLPFASGSGYFVSRDLVELVVQEKTAWRHELLDDVALADLLARSGVGPKPAPRVDYRSAGEVVHVDTSQFHFRCRTASWRRREDARIIRRLHHAFCEARGLSVPQAGLVGRLLSR